MKDSFSIRDIMRILKCGDQVILDDIKAGNIIGHKIEKGGSRFSAWVFSFSESARYINLKMNIRRSKK